MLLHRLPKAKVSAYEYWYIWVIAILLEEGNFAAINEGHHCVERNRHDIEGGECYEDVGVLWPHELGEPWYYRPKDWWDSHEGKSVDHCSDNLPPP